MTLHLHAITIPHDEQRYDTAGDWVLDRGQGTWIIRLSALGDERAESALLLHEMVEMLLCRLRGITDTMVDEWDFTFEGMDPGADPRAPYHREHMFAEKLEKLFCKELGLDWHIYSAMFGKLKWRKK